MFDSARQTLLTTLQHETYRATDTKLKREVAVKVLPSALAAAA